MQGAVVVGDVTVGAQCCICCNAVLRGDVGSISVAAGSNIQDNCVLHTNHSMPLLVAIDVTIGHGCILHSCTVGRGALVGMGSIVLDGAVIGEGAMVAAGTVVPPGFLLPPGMLAMGHPAKIQRPLTQKEQQKNAASARAYVALARKSNSDI